MIAQLPIDHMNCLRVALHCLRAVALMMAVVFATCFAFCLVTYEWRSSKWSKCDVLCGGGVQEREVGCYIAGAPAGVGAVSDSLCLKKELKPLSLQPCNSHECGSKDVQWYTTKWSSCTHKW